MRGHAVTPYLGQVQTLFIAVLNELYTLFRAVIQNNRHQLIAASPRMVENPQPHFSGKRGKTYSQKRETRFPLCA